MLTQQMLAGSLHGLLRQWAVGPAHAACIQAGAHWRVEQHINITSARGAGAAVKAVGHVLRPLNGDVVGQETVGATHPGVGGAVQVGVEVHDLHQAVDPRIGTTGAQGAHAGHIAKGREGLFEFVLNRQAGRLALPALVGRAGVADTERQPHAI